MVEAFRCQIDLAGSHAVAHHFAHIAQGHLHAGKAHLCLLYTSVCLPSVLMTTESHMRPLDRRKGSTAATVPETLEWMFAETKPPASPIFVPTNTSSPFLTRAFAGAPMCWRMRIRTCAGRGIEMCIRDSLNALLPQLVDLAVQMMRVDDHAVAHNADHVRTQDAGGQQMQMCIRDRMGRAP